MAEKCIEFASLPIGAVFKKTDFNDITIFCKDDAQASIDKTKCIKYLDYAGKTKLKEIGLNGFKECTKDERCEYEYNIITECPC